VKYKYANRDLPQGVYAPIWFDGYDGGLRQGHYATYKDGKVWSSPYFPAAHAVELNSIEEVERIYGMKYVGWSEDIGGVKVIEDVGGNNMHDEIGKLWEALNAANQDRDRLWLALDQSNKNAELIKQAIEKLADETRTVINLDDYEIQLTRKDGGS
jgi:hypothetical protein